MPLRHAIAQAVADASTKSDAEARIAAACDAWSENAQLAELIYRPALKADMGGQLAVREIEAGVGPKRVKLAARTPEPFLDLPWDEAVAAFVSRKAMSPEEFYRLSDDARQRGFTATRLLTESLRDRAKSELERVIAEGGDLQSFVAAMVDEGVTLGVGGADIGYLDNVFTTNVLGAYGAGRYRAILDPDVRRARPFVQYRTAGDSRVRESHKKLDGKVFRTDDASWRPAAPPNGFRCRCGIVTLAADNPATRDVLDAIPEGGEPDAGFAAPPSMEI